MGTNPPFETFRGLICKGGYALQSACGTCDRCAWERKQMGVETHAQALHFYRQKYSNNIASTATLEPPRGSGAQVQIVAYKTGRFALQQVSKLRLRPDVYVPVLFETKEGYGMPVLQPLHTAYQVRKALELLRTLWLQPMPYLKTWNITQTQRRAYYTYVRNLPADGLLQSKLDAAWLQAKEQTHATYCNTVHGDATLENCMWSEELRRPCWIDPCVRTDPCSAPLEAELDVAKLLHSVHGYHEMPQYIRGTLNEFIQTDCILMNGALVRFYFLSHLVRLWRHQPAKRKWALQVAERNVWL